MKTISILFITIISFMLSGCSPKLTQSFIDKYDTPKLTSECPDFSGVYEGDLSHHFYLATSKNITGYPHDHSTDYYKGSLKTAIHQNKDSFNIDVLTTDGRLYRKFKIDNFFNRNKLKYDKFDFAGCFNKKLILRRYYAGVFAESPVARKHFRQTQIEKLSDGNLKITYFANEYTYWFYGKSQFEEFGPSSRIVKRIK